MRIKDWGKGLNKDQPPWELAPGFWSDGQNVRFRNGKAERMGGIAASFTTPSASPYWLDHYSSGTSRLLVYATLTKAYKHDGTTETDISFLASAASPTAQRSANVVTVTTGAAHSLGVGDKAAVFVNGDTTFNSTSATITSVTATTFTYANTGANAGPFSCVYYVLQSANKSSFTHTADTKVTGGNFNGVQFVNSPTEGLFYYATSGAQLRQMIPSAFPSSGIFNYIADVARPFKYYMIQLAQTRSGTKYPHNIAWTNSADPGSIPTTWLASSTNDAGNVDLVSNLPMVDCLEWGEDLIVYKGDVRFRLTYIGGNSVFDTRRISSYTKDDGLLAANCVVNTPKGQVFLSAGRDIRIHSGGDSESIAEGRVRNYLRTNISSTNYARSFLCVNPAFNEVWVCFPESGQSTCTKALVWNWNDDTWGTRDLANVTYGASGFMPTTISKEASLVVATSSPALGLVDSGTTDFGSAYTTMLERIGMDFDDPSYKMISRSMPLFDASSNFTASIYHGAASKQDGTPTYSSAATYTHNTTDWVNAFSTSGKYLAWKMTTTASDTPKLRSIDFDVSKQGGF